MSLRARILFPQLSSVFPLPFFSQLSLATLRYDHPTYLHYTFNVPSLDRQKCEILFHPSELQSGFRLNSHQSPPLQEKRSVFPNFIPCGLNNNFVDQIKSVLPFYNRTYVLKTIFVSRLASPVVYPFSVSRLQYLPPPFSSNTPRFYPSISITCRDLQLQSLSTPLPPSNCTLPLFFLLLRECPRAFFFCFAITPSSRPFFLFCPIFLP